MKQDILDYRSIIKQKEKKNVYYAEVTLAVRLESQLNEEEVKGAFSEDGVRAKIKLRSGDGRDIDPEVLEVWGIDWENWDDL